MQAVHGPRAISDVTLFIFNGMQSSKENYFDKFCQNSEIKSSQYGSE